jgi:ABC-2 type transport system permease protein
MISALFYLQFNSLRNRLGARLRRLKRPKYLAGAVIGALYFIFYLSFLVRGPGISATTGQPGLPAPMISIGSENLGALLLLVVVLLGWLLPNARAALAFSEAEIAFLFPAPITRRGLIQYKLIRSQFGILLSIIFLTLIWGRWRQGGQVWISLLGWWVILSTLNLHNLAGSFARTMLLDRGLTNRRRRVLILILVVLVGALVIRGWPSLPDDSGQNPDAFFSGWLAWLKIGLSTGWMPYLLYPFRLVVRPYFAADAQSFLLALWPALAIMAVHYILVIRADVAFEEASIEFSRKVATRIENIRQRQGGGMLAPSKVRRSPFKLWPTGPAPVAFLWKNLILAGNFFSFRTLWMLGWAVFAAFMIVGPTQHHSTGQSIFGLLCLGLAGISLFMGPLLLRADFRSDLPNAELLMLYPLPGWQVVLGEVLAPVAILTVAQWVLIALAAIFIHLDDGDPAQSLHKAVTAIAAAILCPTINLVLLLIPNAVALVLPSWVRFDKNAPRGIENFGQRIILMMGVVVVVAVVLLPAGLAMTGVVLLGSWLVGPIAGLLLGAVAGAAVVVTEAAVAIHLLGFAFENFDVSAETTN